MNWRIEQPFSSKRFTKKRLRSVKRYAERLVVLLANQVSLPSILEEKSQDKIMRTVRGRILFELPLSPVCQALYIEMCCLQSEINKLLAKEFPLDDPFLKRLEVRVAVTNHLYLEHLMKHITSLRKQEEFHFAISQDAKWALGPNWTLILYTARPL